MNLVSYQDSHGIRRKLTRVQWVYLYEVWHRGRLEYGWGGLRSTLTVRVLEERGLIVLTRNSFAKDHRGRWVERWTVSGLTKCGQEVAERAFAEETS